MAAGGNAEDDLVQRLRRPVHRDDDQPRENANQSREYHDSEFARPHQAAQPVGNRFSSGAWIGCHAPLICILASS